MALSYRQIGPEVASRIKLVMTDVDGTLTSGDGFFPAVVWEAIWLLEAHDIMVGLVSGRTLSRLEAFAGELGISGPVIAENGAVAKVDWQNALADLGYSREPALRDLEKLKKLFPDAIEDGVWNRERLVDLAIRCHGVEIKELRRHLEASELLDSGYLLHIMPRGVSKANTLKRLLGEIDDGGICDEEVLVVGDALTDLSLFRGFCHSVLVINPKLPPEQAFILQQAAGYSSHSVHGDGFAEVIFHLLNTRLVLPQAFPAAERRT